MASKRKFYPIKKFAINEIANTFTEIASELEVDPEKLEVSHRYIIDDIEDRDELTIKETGRITELRDNDILNFNLGSYSRSIIMGASSDKLQIIVNGENVNEVKKIFPIVERRLNLIKENDDSNNENDNSNKRSWIKRHASEILVGLIVGLIVVVIGAFILKILNLN